MISEKMCPLCGNIFKVGFDPMTGVEYPFRCINILEIHSSNGFLESDRMDMCFECYELLKNLIKKEADQNE